MVVSISLGELLPPAQCFTPHPLTPHVPRISGGWETNWGHFGGEGERGGQLQDGEVVASSAFRCDG